MCDIGRPPRDAALQNLTVNNTVRVNKLLKSTKAEIDRFCAESTNDGAITFVGSFQFIGVDESKLNAEYSLYLLPSGCQITSSPAKYSLPFLPTVFYTSVDLVVRKFQAAVTTVTSGDVTSNVIVDLNYGTDSNTINQTAVELSLLGTNLNSVRVTDSSGSAVIPAGSYYSIVIKEGPGSTDQPFNLRSSWTLELIPQ